MIEKGLGRSPWWSLRKPSGTKFWLIVKHENGRIRVLTIDSVGDGRKETLPIFSFEAEASTFLRSEAPGDAGWRVEESMVGELVSMLLETYVTVDRVALDPLPVDLGGEAMMSLLSLDRAKFLLSLVDENRLATSAWLSSRPCCMG